MSNNNVVFWSGASGTKYKYWSHRLPCSFNPDQDGNYVYTRAENGYWAPVYIGEGDLGERVSESHHQARCINIKGATHVHVHTNNSESARTAEEKDILAANPQAYQPKGCNVKPGG